jgi:WD40 repeat protein
MSPRHGHLLLLAALPLVLVTPARGAPPATDALGDPLPPGAIAPLGTVRLRHTAHDAVACVAFSPNGKTVVNGGRSGGCAWDVATGEQLDWFRMRLPVSAAAFTPDGKTLLTADDKGSIRLYEVGTGKLLRRAIRPWEAGYRGRASFFSADGKVVGAYAYSGDVRLWEVGSGKLILRMALEERTMRASAALSPEGRTLVVSGAGNRAHLIDVATGQEIRQIEGPNKAPPYLPADFRRDIVEGVDLFTFSPDGRLLAGAVKEAFCLWEVSTGKRLYEVKGPRGPLAFSPDSKLLACGGEGEIRLHEAVGGKEVRRFEPRTGLVRALAFSPDGKALASVQDGALSLWYVATGRRSPPLPGHESTVRLLAFSPDGAELASADEDSGGLIVWDVARRRPRLTLTGHFLTVHSVAFSPDGKTIATGDGYDGWEGFEAQIRLWSAAEGRLHRQFPGHLNRVHSLAFAPDGKTLASAGPDARVRLWNVATGKRPWQIRADSQADLLAFTPDGKALLVAESFGELAFWRTDSGEKLRDLGSDDDRGRGILRAELLRDGDTVVTWEYGPGEEKVDEVRFWDAGSGRLRRSFPLRSPYPYFVSYAVSPDGKTLATGAGDDRHETIQLWDTASGTKLTRLPGHAGAVTALAFSPNGKILASGGIDTTVLLWDVTRARKTP